MFTKLAPAGYSFSSVFGKFSHALALSLDFLRLASLLWLGSLLIRLGSFARLGSLVRLGSFDNFRLSCCFRLNLFLLGFSSSVLEGSFSGEGLLPIQPIAHTLWKVASSAWRHFCSELVTHGTELSVGTLSTGRVSIVILDSFLSDKRRHQLGSGKTVQMCASQLQGTLLSYSRMGKCWKCPCF